MMLPKSTIINLLLLSSLTTNLFLATRLILKNSQAVPPLPAESFNLIHPQAYDITQINDDQKNILHYGTLKDELNHIIAEQASNSATVSLYLQDIRTGATLEINENKGFFPASLLKIPIMMAILKKVDNQQLKLDDKITIKPEDLDNGSGNLYLMGSGTKVTIWDLLSHMIKSSDNTAKNTLKRQLSPAELNSPFSHVGIPNPYLNTDKSINPRHYTRLFKSLYYATYLSPQLSEKALELTTDTTTEILLPAGVPPHIQVAHKYGVQENQTLSDCGIIYEPNTPYMLCIMIASTDQNRSKELIIALSQTIYNSITKTQPQAAP